MNLDNYALLLLSWLVLGVCIKRLLTQPAIPAVPRWADVSWSVLGIVLVAFALWRGWPRA